jgi:Tol biopolymer transport system component
VKAALPLAALVLAITASPAAAAFPGTNGPLAVERAGPAIATVNADGTGAVTDLVATGPADRDPAWSPDGRRLAFTSTRDGNEEIYVLDVESGFQTRLTFDAARDHDPTWSPDGSRIAFAGYRDGNSEIYVMAAAGGIPTRITFDPGTDQQPAWSARDAIALASDRGGDMDLYAIDPAGGGLARLTTEPGLDADPSWAPDGAQLAYTHGDGSDLDVYAIDSAGGNRRVLADTPLFDHFPAWSPDGTRIAFTSERLFADNVFVMPASGETAGQQSAAFVTPGTDPSWGPLPPATTPPERGDTFTIAPAGDRVLVAPDTAEDPSELGVLQARLRTEIEVPVHTAIDATRGTVEIASVTTTPDGPNTVGQAFVTGGVFRVEQGDGAAAEPTLRLDRGRRTCRRARASRVADGARVRIRTRGRFRTVTGYGRGAGRATEWVMHNRCDGTIFKIREGVVRVTDFRRKRSFNVRAGRCYLAAARPRRDARRPRRTCPPLRPPR